MRARNLKPSFFKNEILGGADPLYSLLFEGLWCAADREGRLEDRPLRLCVEVFPYRRELTPDEVDRMLAWLEEHSFITRYLVDGARYIQVLQFGKHQRPHSKEKISEIPAFRSNQGTPRKGKGRPKVVSSTEKVMPSTDLGNGEHALTPDSGLLTPDSGLLTPDSGLLTPDSPFPRSAKEGTALPVVSELPRKPRAATAGLSRNGKHQTPAEDPESERIKRAITLLNADPNTTEDDAARMFRVSVEAIREARQA
jgi:hypothetical protein